MQKNAIQNGAILGMLSIIYTYFTSLFMGRDNWLMMMLLGLLMFIVFITLVIMWGVRYRKTQDNVLSFGKAFIYILIILAISTTLLSVFNIINVKILNPDYANEMIDMSVSQTEKWLVNAGMSDEMIEETLLKVETDTAYRMTLTGMLVSMLWSYVAMIVFSLLLSLFIWKRPTKIEQFDI